MRLEGTFRHRLRTGLIAVLLLPFLFAQLFAPGTMPELGRGGFDIVICTDAGFEAIVLDLDGVPIDHEDDGKICPWATAAHAFVALDQPVVMGSDATLLAVETLLPALRIRAAVAPPLPPARAPPRSV